MNAPRICLMLLCYVRRRRLQLVTAERRLHHLQHYHMKGNPVGNGGTTNQPPRARQSSLPAAYQSSSTEPIHTRSASTKFEMDRDCNQQQYPQRHSHINGDVFYVSGIADTAHCDFDDHSVTTFKYVTYDRDYFRERQKLAHLKDCYLRYPVD